MRGILSQQLNSLKQVFEKTGEESYKPRKTHSGALKKNSKSHLKKIGSFF